MTLGGWITMILSVSSVTLLLIWCIYKIITTPGEADHIHGFDYHDVDDEQSHPRRKLKNQ